MYAATLLADPTRLRLERIISSAESPTLVVRTTAPSSFKRRRPVELPPDRVSFIARRRNKSFRH